jgi:hypothetical protein
MSNIYSFVRQNLTQYTTGDINTSGIIHKLQLLEAVIVNISGSKMLASYVSWRTV